MEVKNDSFSDVVNTSENNSDDSEIMLNKNNGDIAENGVSKNDTLSNRSDNENIMGVEVSDEVIISVNQLEREWRESLSEYGG